MENERKDIRTLAKKYEKLQTLMNYINKETLMEQFRKESSNISNHKKLFLVFYVQMKFLQQIT